MIDDETLLAYLDGELPPPDAARVEEALAGDPALAEKLGQQRALRHRIAAAFDPVADEPAPPALLAAAQPDRIASLADARAKRRGFGLPQWAAIAASLIAGVAGGYALHGGPAGPAIEREGRMIAAGPVARALDTQLASAGPASAPVRVGLTFRDDAGAICRSFTASASSGVACRDKGGWEVRALFAGGRRGEGAYRMATGTDPALMAYVDGIIAGAPFDAAAEAEAKAAGWR